MNFLVLSRWKVERGYADLTEPNIIISITNPDSPSISLTTNKYRLAKLQLSFWDSHPKHEHDMQIDAYMFNTAYAKRIWKFYTQHKDKISTVVVNCEGGISRSSAIAAALAKGIGQPDDDFFLRYYPNSYVYYTLLKTITGEIS
jgi:predicted protein tyrosine phosphatase